MNLPQPDAQYTQQIPIQPVPVAILTAVAPSPQGGALQTLVDLRDH